MGLTKYTVRYIVLVMQKEVNNKENILNVALELFSNQGYDAVGVQSLVEKAGITKPTLYHYYGSKDGVFKAMLSENYSKLNKLVGLNVKYKPNIKSYYEDVFPVLVRLVNAYFNFAKNNHQFYRMVLSALFLPPTSTPYLIVREMNISQYEMITNMFLEISEAHPNMKGKEKRLCWTFIGMINTYIGLSYSGMENLTKVTAKEAVRQFMHGIFN